MTAASSWRVRLAGAGGGTAIAALLRTATFEIERAEGVAPLDQHTGPVIFAFWHGRLLPLTFLHRGRGSVVLVSQHRDGEVIARILDSLGYVTARGSTTRGGAKGLRELIRRAGEGRDIGITPDGPRGPREVAQAGVVAAARVTGLPIVPLSAAVSPAWTLKSWDQFLIPKPFARVFVRYEAPIAPGADPAEDAETLKHVQESLDAATRRVEALAADLAHHRAAS